MITNDVLMVILPLVVKMKVLLEVSGLSFSKLNRKTVPSKERMSGLSTSVCTVKNLQANWKSSINETNMNLNAEQCACNLCCDQKKMITFNSLSHQQSINDQTLHWNRLHNAGCTRSETF